MIYQVVVMQSSQISIKFSDTQKVRYFIVYYKREREKFINFVPKVVKP